MDGFSQYEIEENGFKSNLQLLGEAPVAWQHPRYIFLSTCSAGRLTRRTVASFMVA